MTLLPEVREELVATAARRASTRSRTRRRLRGRPPRFDLGGLAVALGVGCALAVAIVALVALKHRVPVSSQSAAGSSVAALEAKLAVLRRPQTAADRSYPASLAQGGRQGQTGVIMKLTRLAATVRGPTAGKVRVYVIVRRPPTGRIYVPAQRLGSDVVSAVAVDAHGKSQGASGPLSATTLNAPSAIGSGLFIPGAGVNPNVGVTVGIVPDGVTRVRWTFTGAGFGILRPHPVTVYPQVRHNVAVAPITPGQGPLARATWYGTTGQVIATAPGGAQTGQQLQRIRSVNASRSRAIAPFLVAHFSLFRSVPADDPAHDSRLPTPGTEGGYVGQMRLNYWQSRYVPSVRGLDGRGLWITPGARGLCISDPQAGTCGMLTSRNSTGFIGPGTFGAHQETLSGLVPDGNPTVTLVLDNGSRTTVPVIDNVYEATIPGRIVAIIDRNAAGRIERQSLQ